MMNALRWFVRVNRSASAGLTKAFPSIFGGGSYFSDLTNWTGEYIASTKPKVVLEAGGVDRPFLARSPGYHYVGVDLCEQPDCAHLYDQFIVQSIEDPLPIKADLILSVTLLEHVPNNTRSVSAIFAGLGQGGRTFHYLPSGLHPYSIALRLIGPAMQRRLIPMLRPGTEGVTGYPAFFDKCTPAAMARVFEQAGFADISVTPYYRANDYFAFFLPAFVLVSLFENLSSALNLRVFASGFIIMARRP